MRLFLVIFAVEALTASWIEIAFLRSNSARYLVEALTASWIEMEVSRKDYDAELVEALTASWIEIQCIDINNATCKLSKPLRLRGLK